MYRIASIPLLVMLCAGCTVPNTQLRDQPQIERLRIQIGKARNAIEETRAAITEARGAPYLPELYVRLAELMSDEARYHYQVAFEREQRSNKNLHVPQVRFLKERSISIYKRVLKDYPDTPLAPRVLFNMGQEHRELGNYDEMRAAFEQLVNNHPNSRLKPEALFILGDDRFDRGELKAAGTFYARMFEGQLTRMTGVGHHKLAWVYVNQGECKKALVHFEKALVRTEAYFALPKSERGDEVTSSALDVRREALVDLVYCYTQENRDKNAIAYLRDRAYRRSAYVAALEKLASRLATIDAPAGAILAARELLRLAPDTPDRVDDARMLFAGIRKTKDFTQVGDDVQLISRAMLRQIRKPTSAQEERTQLFEELENIVRDLSTRAQDIMLKLPKGSKKRQALGVQVARAYESHINTFPTGEYKTEMLRNLVDVLIEMESHFKAGRRAIEVAQRLPKGDEQDNAWYDALVNLQATLSKPATRMQRVVARAGLRKSGAALLARKLPAERARKVKYAVAITDFDEGRYRVAIDRLNAIAFEYPGTDEGDTAVDLVLHSYRTLNDYLGLIRAGHRFMDQKSPVAANKKKEVAPIVQSAEQFQLDDLALAAAGVDGGDVTGDLERFAETYKGSKLGERALINAVLAARASGDSASLYRLADEFEKKYPKSDQVSAVHATIGRTAASRFEMDQAIRYFAKAAESSTGQKVALLVAAGSLKHQLGDSAGAKASFQAALKAADTPAAKNQAAIPLAAILEREGNPKGVVSTLQGLGDDADAEALAYLGSAQILLGQTDDGENSLQQVLDSTDAVSAQARARAQFGQAEVLQAALAKFEPEADLDMIQEFIAIIEVTEQGYLSAAREGDPLYTAAALARLAYLAKSTAPRMEKLALPPGTDAATAKMLKESFQARANTLKKRSKQALEACAGQGWIHKNFNPVVRQCMKGEAPAKNPIAYEPLSPRKKAPKDPSLEPLRVRLSKNTEDLEALTGIGKAFLAQGDFHAARLVFSKAGQAGGGPLESNLLGIACYRAGDISCGLDAFAQAASGGLAAGRDNLVTALRTLGLKDAAQEATKRYKGDRSGGMRLGGGS